MHKEPSPETWERFADFCKRYYVSNTYKNSQKFLRDLVRKNTETRYNLTVPKPTQEK